MRRAATSSTSNRVSILTVPLVGLFHVARPCSDEGVPLSFDDLMFGAQSLLRAT